MRGIVPSEVKEEIRRRLDIVEVASAYVTLKKAGRYYKGLCPFHQEKTPSFFVDKDRGLFHCFGCGAGGDLFDLVMRLRNLTFPEALEELARRAGVQIERTPEAFRRASEREQLFQVLEAAVACYEECLRDPRLGAVARSYLARRGVPEVIARRFRLGYAPGGGDHLLRELQRRGFSPSLMESAGLMLSRGDGTFYDMFRHRLIFPILDLQDRPVALGGRALDESIPKYLNSKETAVFTKGKTLYALNWARESIRTSQEAVLVEGYMDALTCHQYGVANAVATLGTSLTLDQVLLLKRFASRAILVYDSDIAGRAAVERALGLFEEAEVDVRIVVLPGEQDPDRFLRDHGVERFRHLLSGALSMFEYALQQAVTRHDLSTVEGKTAVVDELIPVLYSVVNPIRQEEFLHLLADRLGLREDPLRQRLRQMRRRQSQKPVQEEPAATPVVISREGVRLEAERLLLRLMLEDQGVVDRVRRALGPEDFLDPRHREIATLLLTGEVLGEGKDLLLGIRDRLRGEGAEEVLARIVFEAAPILNPRKTEEGCIRRIKAESLRGRLDALPALIRDAELRGDHEQVGKFLEEQKRLLDLLKTIEGGSPTGLPSKSG